mgnify:CR=1 FL=1|jgi:alpha-ketoglutarate-dependent 2,4-dichlorophenoxyacetate dioxygenase
MQISIAPLTPVFGARVSGVDINKPLEPGAFAAIRAAFDDHLVLVFSGQPMTDEQQVAFSERFGALEGTAAAGVNPGAGTPFARQSNLDIESGETISGDDRRMFYQRANMFWHCDSAFKAIPSLCSVLSARIVPPEGGATELASTRAAYASLGAGEQAEIGDLIVEYDFEYSRSLAGFTFAPGELSEVAPVRHRLVRTNKANGLKSVMIGAHAKCIVGWPEDESRALLDDLLARATRPQNTYRHHWRQDDVIIWDNQAAVHRATAYDTTNHRRLMQRTTISSGGASEF